MNTVEKLEGPVFPVVTPFIEDKHQTYPIDTHGLRRYLEYLLNEGAWIIMVASATSRFAQLTEEEIRLINAVVVEQVGSRGIPIALTGILGSTR